MTHRIGLIGFGKIAQDQHVPVIAASEAFELAAVSSQRGLGPEGVRVVRDYGELLADLKRDFAVVRHVKPGASRADSSELYVLATGFRGSSEPTA